jgi:hypothetical protein
MHDDQAVMMNGEIVLLSNGSNLPPQLMGDPRKVKEFRRDPDPFS